MREIDADAFNKAATAVHENAVAHGLLDLDPTDDASEAAMRWLIEEANEAMEALLNDGLSDHIPSSRLAEELADVILVALSISKSHEINIGKALQDKHRYNVLRPYKHGRVAP